jgi:dihydroflavonol-4-reductase
MRVFVTGGNGFIGSAVVRALIAAGHGPVCLLRKKSRADRIEGLPIERVAGDVRDVASLRRGMVDCHATIHLAAPGGWAGDDPALLRDVIEGGTRNVVAAAAHYAGNRVVYVSSTAAIAASDEPRIFDERSEFNIRDKRLHYAHAKHRAEGLVLDAAERGLDVVIVNPGEVYGPGDTGLVSAQNLIDFAKSWPVLVCRGGTAIVDVDDVAAGIVAALDRGRTRERYILAGENLTIRQLADLTLQTLGRRAPVVPVPNWLARSAAGVASRLRLPFPYSPDVVAYATRYWFVNSAKARTELNVEFRDARATIGATIEWLIAAGYLKSSREP